MNDMQSIVLRDGNVPEFWFVFWGKSIAVVLSFSHSCIRWWVTMFERAYGSEPARDDCTFWWTRHCAH
jgi:hypothetical protein